jgi:hypothetical protein
LLLIRWDRLLAAKDGLSCQIRIPRHSEFHILPVQEVNDHIKRMCAAYLAVPQPTLTPVPYPGYSVDPEDIYFPMAE